MTYFLNKNYPKLILENKIDSLNPKHLILLKEDYFIGHWDFEKIYKSIKKKEKFAVISGFSASGKLHLGNELVLETIFDLKKLGGKIFITLSDTESLLTRKTSKKSNESIDSFKKDLKKWAFDTKNSEIYLHSLNKETIHLLDVIRKKITPEDFKKIYGPEINENKILALSNMLVDIFYPYKKGYKKVLVILGIDEIKHAKLAIYASQKLGFQKPSFLYLKILNGLNKGKMSKSKTKENILLSDSPRKVKQKIRKSNPNSLEIVDDPFYQIGLWILKIDKRKLENMLKNVEHNKFKKIISKKLVEKYKSLDNGKNKNNY
jgi:tryptophanyl-tRNA synthetase